jgi:outer membrane protein W
MRAISIICILTIFLGKSFAQDQIKQKVYSLGGSIYYSSNTEEDPHSSYDQSLYVVIPSISYFVVDQCELSVSIGYIRSTTTFSGSSLTTSSSESKWNSLALGLGIRYYLPAGKISPFIGASGGVNWISSQGESYSTPTAYYSLTGGLEIFISASAAIEPALVYSKYHYSEQDSRSSLQVGIGVKYFIL